MRWHRLHCGNKCTPRCYGRGNMVFRPMTIEKLIGATSILFLLSLGLDYKYHEKYHVIWGLSRPRGTEPDRVIPFYMNKDHLLKADEPLQQGQFQERFSLQKRMLKAEDVNKNDISKGGNNETRTDNISEDCLTCKGNCKSWECWVCDSCLSKRDRGILAHKFRHFTRGGKLGKLNKPRFQNKKMALQWHPETSEKFKSLAWDKQLRFLWYRHRCIENEALC